MTAAGFDPRAMAAFFQRMLRVNNVGESSVPGYMRTHPLTTDRIADMQDRARNLAVRNLPQQPEFGFAKVRARVLQETTPGGFIEARNLFVSGLQSASTERQAVLYYGIAFAEQKLGRLDAAEQSLMQARRAYGNIPGSSSGSPNLDVLAIELARDPGRPDEALTQAEAALHAYPLSRAVAQAYAQSLVAARELDKAIAFLRGKTREDRTQPLWWDGLARAYAAQGKRVQQHQALAEKYALNGAWTSAIEQLRLARTAGDGDFYLLSEVDARLHQLERQYAEEKQDNKGLPN
jgi:predicted Zn-dependent protease